MSKTVEIDFFIFAENVLNTEYNKISLVNIFEEIYAPSLPTIQLALQLCIKLKIFNQTENADLNMKIRISDPQGNVVGTSEIENLKKYSSKFPTYYLTLNGTGMPIKSYGKYTYELLLDDKVVGAKSIEVKSHPTEEAA